jgi:hypothetical protein
MVKTKGNEPRLRAVVHIGPVKTGSTAFTRQMTTSQERGELGETIVYALPREVHRHGESHLVLPEHMRHLAPKLEWVRQSGEVHSATRYSSEAVVDRVLTYLDDLTTEIRLSAKSDTTVFFVEEALSRRPGPGHLPLEVLTHFDSVDFVLVARAQQFIVPSAISQRIKTGAYPSAWDPRVSTFLSNENLSSQFDYANIIDRWVTSDPRARVIVVPFLESDRGTQNLFHRILANVGVRANLGEPVKSEVNVTPTRFEIAAIGFFKKATFRGLRNRVPRDSIRLRAFNFAKLAFALFARIIRSPQWTVTPDERKRIVDFYQPANIRFREKLGKQAKSAEWTEWFQQSGIRDR